MVKCARKTHKYECYIVLQILKSVLLFFFSFPILKKTQQHTNITVKEISGIQIQIQSQSLSLFFSLTSLFPLFPIYRMSAEALKIFIVALLIIISSVRYLCIFLQLIIHSNLQLRILQEIYGILRSTVVIKNENVFDSEL